MSPTSQRSVWEEDAPDTVRKASASVRARAPRKSDDKSRRGRHRGGSSVPPSLTAHPSRAPEAASSTLRQNKAFVERLRRAAIRSDRPPPTVRTMMLGEDMPREEEAAFDLLRPASYDVLSIPVPQSPAIAMPELIEVTAQLPPARRAAERALEAARTKESSRLRKLAIFGAILLGLSAMAAGIYVGASAQPPAHVAPTSAVSR